MKKRVILYVIISAICIIAIIAGVYYQIFGSKNKSTNIVADQVDTTIDENGVIDREVLKEEFDSLFDNSFNSQDYETSNIQKSFLKKAEKPSFSSCVFISACAEELGCDFCGFVPCDVVHLNLNTDCLLFHFLDLS